MTGRSFGATSVNRLAGAKPTHRECCVLASGAAWNAAKSATRSQPSPVFHSAMIDVFPRTGMGTGPRYYGQYGIETNSKKIRHRGGRCRADTG